jgi:hypothetical protein
MNLAYTRSIVSILADNLLPWPPLWQDGPDLAVESGIKFMQSIGVCSESAIDNPELFIHTAIDEWLLSSEIDKLSTMQRGICAVALLEFYSHSEHYDTTSPGIDTAVQHIAAALPILDMAAKGIVASVCHQLLQRKGQVLDQDEVGLLLILECLLRYQLFSSVPAQVDISMHINSWDDATECEALLAMKVAILDAIQHTPASFGQELRRLASKMSWNKGD